MTHYTSIGNFRSTWVHIVLAAVAGRCCTSIRKPSSVNRGICVAGFSINDHRCPWISFSSHSTISRLGIIADVSNYFDLNAYHAITLLDPCEDSGSVSGPFPSRNIGNVVLCRPRNAHASDAAAASAPLKCTGLSLNLALSLCCDLLDDVAVVKHSLALVATLEMVPSCSSIDAFRRFHVLTCH